MKGYIIFLLGADDFNACKEIRKMAERYGMDNIFEQVRYIARQFRKYDKQYYSTLSEYESFEQFIVEYEQDILEYLHNNKKFKVKVGK